MAAPDPDFEERDGARQAIARAATLGGLHALRNAMQVVRSYTQLEMPEGPGKEGTASGLERILEVTGALEGLLGQVPVTPAPNEFINTLRLLPELFVYDLRTKGLKLEVVVPDNPSLSLLSWDVLLLISRLLQAILDGCSLGMGGRLDLILEAEEISLGWVPDEGTLPFPLLSEPWPRDIDRLAAEVGVNLALSPGRYGFIARLDPAAERSP